MTTNFVYGAVGTVMNLLTTELNGLANGTLSAAGPEINNTSGYQEGQLTLTLASAAFVANSLVDVFLVPSTDTAGTAYPTATSAAVWGGLNYRVGTIVVNGSTAAQKEMLPYVRIPLGKFKAYLLTGGSCPTLGGTGNTLDLYPTPSAY